MGHAEVVALARRNQQAQKRDLTTRESKQPPKPSSDTTPKSPGNTAQPQWLKHARNRLGKKTPLNEFNTNSKDAAIQHSTNKAKGKTDNRRKLLYSSSSENKSITSMETPTLKFSPTVKVFSVPSDPPGTSYEIITSTSPDYFMNTDHKSPSRDIDEPYTVQN